MRNTLWTVMTVTAVFLGFALGYSTSPMLDVGIDVVRGKQAPVSAEVDEELEKYYSDLLTE